MPEWLLSMLVSFILATLSTIISTLIANKRTKKEILAKQEELVQKYELDKKQHISNKRLDMEFEIYKELSEKVVTLVANCLGLLFDNNFDYNQIGNRKRNKYDIDTFDEIVKLSNVANEAINKYAIFIPEKWYNKFQEVKGLCKNQLDAFYDYVIEGNLKNKSIQNIKKECRNRFYRIGNLFVDLVNELRTYISSTLGVYSIEEKQKTVK